MRSGPVGLGLGVAHKDLEHAEDDVDLFKGHIACSSSTKSELVIPCFDQGGHLFGVLDIDSDQPNFFKWQDADQLDQMLRQLFQNASL